MGLCSGRRVWSSLLDPADGVLIDISPASVGNISEYPADVFPTMIFMIYSKAGYGQSACRESQNRTALPAAGGSPGGLLPGAG